MSVDNVYVNADSGAPKFPTDKQEFVYWVVKMRAYLKSRGLTKFIEMNESESSSKIDLKNEDGASSKKSSDASVDEKSIDRVFSILVLCLSTEQMKLCHNEVMTADPRALWKKLNSVYGVTKNTDSMMSVMSQLQQINKMKNESVKEFLGRISVLISTLVQIDGAVSDSRRKYYIMTGLSRAVEWRGITDVVSAIDKNDEWSVNDLETYLISEDNRRNMSKSSSTHNNTSIISLTNHF